MKKDYRRVKELEAEAEKESAAFKILIARFKERQAQVSQIETAAARQMRIVASHRREKPIKRGEEGYRNMGTERKPAARKAIGSTPLRKDDGIYRDEHGPYKLLYLKKEEHGAVKVDPEHYDALVNKPWSWTMVKGQWICARYINRMACRLDRAVAKLAGLPQPDTQLTRPSHLANDYRSYTLQP